MIFLNHQVKRALCTNLKSIPRKLTINSPLQKRHISDNSVRITDVSPRDGLQNEEKIVPLKTKLELIERLASAGLDSIEFGSFVPPKLVPQMAESGEILKNILKSPPKSSRPITYSFLVPNNRGLDNALSIFKTFSSQSESAPARTTEIPPFNVNIFTSATETFCQRNLNCSIENSLANLQPVIIAARDAKLGVRAYISVVFGCPFEGKVSPSTVASIATKLLSMGVTEVDLGDTTGLGTPSSTLELLRTLRAAGVSKDKLTMHFHDTYGMALVNTAVSLEHGVRSFDGSVAGLGGCPFSPGATGNVGTEDLVYFCDSLGMGTGIDLEALARVGEWIGHTIGRTDGSRVGKAITQRTRVLK